MAANLVCDKFMLHNSGVCVWLQEHVHGDYNGFAGSDSIKASELTQSSYMYTLASIRAVIQFLQIIFGREFNFPS